MTQAEKNLEFILRERIENMVNEVLSQAMIDPGHNIPEAVGAFDKKWVKKIFVVRVALHEGVKMDAEEMGEDVRGKIIGALFDINRDADFAVATIGREWDEGHEFVGTYVLSVDKDTLSEWKELTDDNVRGYAMKYILENNDEPYVKGILIREAEFEISLTV